MPEPARSVWLRVAHGVESLSEAGARVWHEPAQTRKALGELLGVFPVTHVHVDLAALVGAGDPGNWAALLARDGHWRELLGELAQALRSALRPPAVWGLGLPSPSVVAAALGDTSERGVLKAGLQLAAFLQAFREAQIGFVALDVGDPPHVGEPRAMAPIFRNAEMYGWRRAVCVADMAATKEPHPGAEIILVADARVAELSSAWARGEAVGGGLCGNFWGGEEFDTPAPPRFFLYGDVPRGTEPRAIVQAGRMLRGWMA